MLKKGSLFSVAILFLLFVIGCSPPEKCKEPPPDPPEAESCNPPTANAGDSITLTDLDGDGTELVNLDGTGSIGNIVEYEWSEEDAVLGTESTLSYAFSEGIHMVVLSVTNDCGATDKDAIYVNVLPFEENSPPSQAPIANAGTDQTILITGASAVHLDGSGSYDPDGDDLNYLWTSVDETITFDPDNRSVAPKVSLPAPGDYFFVLIVDDGVSYSKPDIVAITVAQPDAWVDSTLPNDIPSEFKFKTIQAAIDAVSDGTKKVIVVINGPYNEKLSVEPNIHLIGLKPSSFTAEMPQIIYENDLDYRNAVVSLQNNAVLENFEIACNACTYCDDCSDDTTAKAAINIEGVNTTIKKCSIIGSDNSAYDGIWVKENMSGRVTGSEIKEVAGEGIQLEDRSELVVENSLIFKTGGSSIWARGCYRVEVKNSISYHAGWHGFDFSGCNQVKIEHCTIVDFGRSDDSCQSGIFVKCGNISLKSNLIEIKGTLNEVATTTLRGVVYNEADNPCTPENENITCTSSNLTYLNNYIYTKQDIQIFYGGEIATEPVDSSNYPTSNNGTTSDPLFIDPDTGDFRLDQNSPALGLGEDGTNPGAEGPILNLPK